MGSVNSPQGVEEASFIYLHIHIHIPDLCLSFGLLSPLTESLIHELNKISFFTCHDFTGFFLKIIFYCFDSFSRRALFYRRQIPSGPDTVPCNGSE